jgi:membrane-associated protein
LNTVFLSALQHFGYPALWFIVFIAAVGVPVSGSLLLFAAGAFAAFGDFNIFILFPVALSSAVLGDNLGYFIGRWVGDALIGWIERQKRFRWMSPQSIEKGREYFRRRTGWAIFLTRFLIVALGGPINILAGLERYSFRRFLFWDISGQAICALITLGLGFFFAESWLEVATIFGTFSTLFLALAIAVILLVVIWRRIRRYRVARADKLRMQQESLNQEHEEQLPSMVESVEQSTTVEQIEQHVESPISD